MAGPATADSPDRDQQDEAQHARRREYRPRGPSSIHDIGGAGVEFLGRRRWGVCQRGDRVEIPGSVLLTGLDVRVLAELVPGDLSDGAGGGGQTRTPGIA